MAGGDVNSSRWTWREPGGWHAVPACSLVPCYPPRWAARAFWKAATWPGSDCLHTAASQASVPNLKPVHIYRTTPCDPEEGRPRPEDRAQMWPRRASYLLASLRTKGRLGKCVSDWQLHSFDACLWPGLVAEVGGFHNFLFRKRNQSRSLLLPLPPALPPKLTEQPFLLMNHWFLWVGYNPINLDLGPFGYKMSDWSSG